MGTEYGTGTRTKKAAAAAAAALRRRRAHDDVGGNSSTMLENVYSSRRLFLGDGVVLEEIKLQI